MLGFRGRFMSPCFVFVSALLWALGAKGWMGDVVERKNKQEQVVELVGSLKPHLELNPNALSHLPLSHHSLLRSTSPAIRSVGSSSPNQSSRAKFNAER